MDENQGLLSRTQPDRHGNYGTQQCLDLERLEVSRTREKGTSSIIPLCIPINIWLYAVVIASIALFIMKNATLDAGELRNKLNAWWVESLIWLAYVAPNPSLWDSIHRNSTVDVQGGVWHYKKYVHDDIFRYVNKEHGDYNSLLDLSCNLGLMLGRFEAEHPDAHHYGTDISQFMVNRTAERCKSCVVGQLDINDLRDPEWEKIGAGFPPVFDLVVVSDVLYYMKWGGWPPFVCQFAAYLGIPTPQMIREDQKRFFKHLTGLASTEVIFSAHQENHGVIDFLTAMNATRKGALFTAPGTG